MKVIKKSRTARKSLSRRAEDVERIDSLAETELLENDEMYHQNYQHKSHEQQHQHYQGQTYRQSQGTSYAEYNYEEYRQYSTQDRSYRGQDLRQRANCNDKENKTDPYNLDYYMAKRDESRHSDNKRKSYSPIRSRYGGRRDPRRGSSSHGHYSNSPRRSHKSLSPRENSSGSTPRHASRHRIRSYRSSSKSSTPSSRSTRSSSGSSVCSSSPARIAHDNRDVNEKKRNRGYSSKRQTSVVSKLYGKRYGDSFSRGYNRRHFTSKREDTKVEVTVGDLTMSPISSDDFSQRSEEAESEADKEDIAVKKIESIAESETTAVRFADSKKEDKSKSINNSQKLIDEHTTKDGKKVDDITDPQEGNFATLGKDKSRIVNVSYGRLNAFESKRKFFEEVENQTKLNYLEKSSILSDDLSQQNKKAGSEVSKSKNKANDSKLNCSLQEMIKDTTKIENKCSEINKHQEERYVSLEKDDQRIGNITGERLQSYKSKRKSFEKGVSNVENKTLKFEKIYNGIKNSNRSAGFKHSFYGKKEHIKGKKDGEMGDNNCGKINLKTTVETSSSIQARKCDVQNVSAIQGDKDGAIVKKDRYIEMKSELSKNCSFQELKDTLLQSNMDNKMVDKIVHLMASKSKINKDSKPEKNYHWEPKVLDKEDGRSCESLENKKSSGRESDHSSNSKNEKQRNKCFENKGKVRHDHASENNGKDNKNNYPEKGFEGVKNKIKQSDTRKSIENTYQTIIDEHPFTKNDTFTDKEINELKVKVAAKMSQGRPKAESKTSPKTSDRQNEVNSKTCTLLEQKGELLEVCKTDTKLTRKSDKKLDSLCSSHENLSIEDKKSSSAPDLDQSESHTLSLSDKQKYFESRIKSNDRNENKNIQSDLTFGTRKDGMKNLNYINKKLVVSLDRVDMGKYSHQITSSKNKSINLTEKNPTEVRDTKIDKSERTIGGNSEKDLDDSKGESYSCGEIESKDSTRRKSVSDIVDDFNRSDSNGKSVSVPKVFDKNSNDIKSAEKLESCNDSRKIGLFNIKESKDKKDKRSELMESNDMKEKHLSVKERKALRKNTLSGLKESNNKKRKLSGNVEDCNLKEIKMTGAEKKWNGSERKLEGVKDAFPEGKRMCCMEENDKFRKRKPSGVIEDVKLKEKKISDAKENDNLLERKKPGVKIDSNYKERRKSGVNEHLKDRKHNGKSESNNKDRKSCGYIENNTSAERKMTGIQESDSLNEGKQFEIKCLDEKERYLHKVAGIEKSRESQFSGNKKIESTKGKVVSGGNRNNDMEISLSEVVEKIKSKERKQSGDFEKKDCVENKNLPNGLETKIIQKEVRISNSESKTRKRRISDVEEGHQLDEKCLPIVKEYETHKSKNSPKTVKTNDSPKTIKTNDSRQRKLSGIVENSSVKEGISSGSGERNNSKERRLLEVEENSISRERRLSGVIENKNSRERRGSRNGDFANTRKRHCSESASPRIVKATINRPSFGVYIPLGKPSEKRKLTPTKPTKQVTPPEVSDFDNPESEEKSVPVKETGSLLNTEVDNKESSFKEQERKVTGGESSESGPKRSLFGKNKKRISHYNDKDAQYLKRNQTVLLNPYFKRSPAETTNDVNQTKVISPCFNESPAKRPKISNENKKKLLRSFIKGSPVKRLKHPFKQFPVDRYSSLSPGTKKVTDKSGQEKTAKVNEYSNETTNLRTKPPEAQAALSPIDNIFEKMEETNSERNKGVKLNDGKSKPVVKRTHEGIASNTIGKRRKDDVTVSEKATKGSYLDGIRETYDSYLPTISKDNDNSDKVIENSIYHQKSKFISNERKLAESFKQDSQRSLPNTSKSQQKVNESNNFLVSNSSKEGKYKEVQAGCANETNNPSEFSNETSLTHDESIEISLRLENSSEHVKEVGKDIQGNSDFGMKEQASLNCLADGKSPEDEKSINKQDVSNLSEKQIEREITIENVPTVESLSSAKMKVKKLFKGKHRKNIPNAKIDESDSKLEKLQTIEMKNNEPKIMENDLTKTRFKNKTPKACIEELKKDDICKSKINEDEMIPKVTDTPFSERIVENHSDNKTEENVFSAVIDKVIDNLFEKQEIEIDQNNDGEKCLLGGHDEENACKDSDSDMDDVEPLQMMGFTSLNDVSTEEINESIVSNPEIDMKCGEACHKFKFIDDSVIIHSCVKSENERILGSGNRNEVISVSKRINKDNPLGNISNRSNVAECVVDDYNIETAYKANIEAGLSKANEGESIDINKQDDDTEKEVKLNLPKRPTKNAVRKRFSSQLDILGKKIEEETDNEQIEINKSEKEMRDSEHSKYQKLENTEKELSDDNDDSDLISSGTEITPSKQTKTTDWLKKAKSNVKVPKSIRTQNAFKLKLESVNDSNNTKSKVTKLSVEIATTGSEDSQNCVNSKEKQSTPTQFFQPWNDTENKKSPQIANQDSEVLQQCNSVIDHGNSFEKNFEQNEQLAPSCPTIIAEQQDTVAFSVQNVSNTPMFNALTAKFVNGNSLVRINNEHAGERNHTKPPVVENDKTNAFVNMSQPKAIIQSVQKAPYQLKICEGKVQNMNSPMVDERMEISAVQQPAKSKAKEQARKQELSLAGEASSQQAQETEEVGVLEKSKELRKIALYMELCALDNIKTGDGMRCGRNKATVVIQDMAKVTQKFLTERMLQCPYTISTDGSNDAVSKQYPIVVRAIDPEAMSVHSELLSVPICDESATGENIFNLISKELEVRQIPWKNCLSLGCDNASVMTGCKKVGLDIMLLAEKSYLRGMMMLNKDILRSVKMQSEKEQCDQLQQKTLHQKGGKGIQERVSSIVQLRQIQKK